ncbi:MAG: response regulator [Desulfobacteraceae bacterium]|nr:response regulator [Desulfobacteraceae bacterium]
MAIDKEQQFDTAADFCGSTFSESAGLCTGEGKPVFDAFMGHLPVVAFFKDRESRYLYINNYGCELFKKPLARFLGHTDAEIWDVKTASVTRQNDETVFSTGKTVKNIESIPVNGELRYFRVTKFLVLKSGNGPRLAGFYMDITDKVAAENENTRLHQQLLQAQKMEAIGTLAGGIAHDFNNLLAAIIGYVEIVRHDMVEDNKAAHPLDQVLKASQRAKELVNQILTFSRKSEVEKKPVRLTPVIREAMQLIRASLPSSIEIEQHIDVDKDTILGDATQIHQVAINLCTNAAHAMTEDGGILSITVDSVNFRAGDHLPARTMKYGTYMRLIISDTGLGMSSIVLKRIFDPFFTTKEVGKGTGMGLSVVHGIVRDHGGEIFVDSARGRGSAFQVLFPLIDEDVYSDSVADAAIPGGSETILFVDDEKYLLDMGKQMLERLGYTVESRASAIDAFEAFNNNPDKYDLLFTDLTMPNMAGDELARRIRQERPDIPVIICSGYGEFFKELRAGDLGIDAFLKKPVGMIQVANTIRQVLDQRKSDVVR